MTGVLTVDVHTHFAPLDVLVAARRGQGFDGMTAKRVLDELGTLRLVLTHGGGYLPYQIGRLDHGYRVRPEAKGCAHPPSAYLTRFWFDTVTHAPGPLRLLAGPQS